jgi:hypothetical protein
VDGGGGAPGRKLQDAREQQVAILDEAAFARLLSSV